MGFFLSLIHTCVKRHSVTSKPIDKLKEFVTNKRCLNSHKITDLLLWKMCCFKFHNPEQVWKIFRHVLLANHLPTLRQVILFSWVKLEKQFHAGCKPSQSIYYYSKVLP